MKSEWKKVTLSAVADFNPRETLPKGRLAKKVPMDILQSFCRKIPAYNEEIFKGGTKFRNGDTLMARITPCLENGKTSRVDILEDGEVGFGSTEYIVFRAKEGALDSYFLYYLVRSDIVREPAIKSMVGSSGRQRVQTDVLEKLCVKVPSLPTQRKIAAVLSSLDDKIETNHAICRNLEEQADAFYKQHFVSGEKSSWNEGKLSDLIEVKYGKDHKKLADGTIPVYGSGGLMRYAERALYESESVLIPRKGTLNNVMLVMEPFWTVDTMFYSVMKVKNAAKFVFHFLKGKDLASMNAGSAVPSMTTEILNSMELRLPPKAVLADFEHNVAPIYQTIATKKRENDCLAALRDTLLPRLMSGKLNVSAVKL